MAEFQEQVMGLTGLTIDNSSTNPSRAEFTTFLTDGAKEIINILPLELKQKCSKVTNLYIGNTDTTMDLDGVGKILYVTRENANSGYYIGCREVSPLLADSANDSTSLHYATATDPVYWTESNSSGNPTLFVKPTPDSNQPAKIMHVSYPTVAYNDSIIANFPDEAEYLVALYAAIKSIQSTMGAMNSNTDINTAFSAVTDAVGQAEIACAKFASATTDSQFDTNATWDATNSQLTLVKDALDNAKSLFDTDLSDDDGNSAESALYWLNDEDTEMVQATLQSIQTEIQRAQAHIAEWVSIGDMRVKEIQSALAEANGYISEAKIRMERESQRYTWYQAQQIKLQQDYDKGIIMLTTGKAYQPKKGKKDN